MFFSESSNIQKQPSRGVLMKKCSENMQKIYRKVPMSKWDFNKVTKQMFLEKTTLELAAN